MSVPIVRAMRTNDDGTKEQIFPQTHIDAVFGLADVFSDGVLSVGVNSINGLKGDVKLEVLSEQDYMKIMKFISEYNPNGTGTVIDGKTLTNEEYQDVVKIISAYKLGELGGSGATPEQSLTQIKSDLDAYKKEVDGIKDSLITINDKLSKFEQVDSLLSQDEYKKIQKIIKDYDDGSLGQSNMKITFEKIGEVI